MRHQTRTSFTRLMVVALMVVMAGCGGGGDSPAAPGAPSGPSGSSGPANPPGGGSTSNQISVVDNAFNPEATTVAAGTTITWTFQNTLSAHNVTFAGGVNSSDMQTGTFQRAFNSVGVFVYNCTRHGGMTGTITVQ